MKVIIVVILVLSIFIFKFGFFDITGNVIDHEHEHGDHQNAIRNDKELIIETQSIDLYPHKHGGGKYWDHGEVVYSENYTLEKDIWIKGYYYEPINTHQSTIHHLILYDNRHYDGNYDHIVFSDFISASADFNQTAVRYNDSSDYRHLIPKGTTITLEAMFHNPFPPYGLGINYSQASVRLHILYEEGEFKETEKLRLSLNDNASSDKNYFKVPPNTHSFVIGNKDNPLGRSRHIFNKSGVMGLRGGHIHGWEGGKNIKVYLNDELLETINVHKKGNWTYITDIFHNNVEISKGDEIYISAEYNTSKFNDSILDAMGVYVFYFEPHDKS